MTTTSSWCPGRSEETVHRGTRQGIIEALAVTGGVITSAGILLAAVFTVLGVLPVIVLTEIGIIVGVGVLLDTLLVRTVLVPASVHVLGDRFWAPGRLSRPRGTRAAASELSAHDDVAPTTEPEPAGLCSDVAGGGSAPAAC